MSARSPIATKTRASFRTAVSFRPSRSFSISSSSFFESLGASSGSAVVSIFVNPTQFAPGEDLARYPRTFEADLELCAGAEVDVVFAPSADEVYPQGEPEVTVDPGPLGDVLEGVSIADKGREIFELVLRVASGERSRSELLGYGDNEFVPWQIGAVM